MEWVRVRVGPARFGLAASISLAAAAFVFTSPPAEARSKRHHGHRVARTASHAPPYAAMMLDAKTGRVMVAQNEDEPRHPASVTKVMTLYLLFEALDSGRISLQTELPVSARAAAQSPSKLYLRPGETISVEDAIKAMVTKSANDVAVVIAEYLGGSEDAFAERMTRKARALGMSRTTYVNASGLPDAEQVTTARDLVTLGRAIQDRFPRYYRYFQTRVFNYAGAAHRNHNKLLGQVEGVDGIKTGFTNRSGFNLLTSVRTADRHVIGVILGGRSGRSRDQAMAALIRTNLPRAYAGARIAPPVGEGRIAVADATSRAAADPDGEGASATTASTRPSRGDGNPIRPVVATAAGGSATTPSALRWSSGAQPLPATAHAYAALQAPEANARPVPLPPPITGKVEARLDVPPIAAPAKPEPSPKAEEARREAAEPRRETTLSRPVPRSPWVIQLGAPDDEGKAKSILEEARKASTALAKASPFTEKVVHAGTTLYRARFSGFSEADTAQEACKVLKRNGFSCFATRS
jgi:D-alanyl-D-alanine carboxypeptidase